MSNFDACKCAATRSIVKLATGLQEIPSFFDDVAQLASASLLHSEGLRFDPVRRHTMLHRVFFASCAIFPYPGQPLFQ